MPGDKEKLSGRGALPDVACGALYCPLSTRPDIDIAPLYLTPAYTTAISFPL